MEKDEKVIGSCSYGREQGRTQVHLSEIYAEMCFADAASGFAPKLRHGCVRIDNATVWQK